MNLAEDSTTKNIFIFGVKKDESEIQNFFKSNPKLSLKQKLKYLDIT